MHDALRKKAGRSWNAAENTQDNDVPMVLEPSPPKPKTILSNCQNPTGKNNQVRNLYLDV